MFAHIYIDSIGAYHYLYVEIILDGLVDREASTRLPRQIVRHIAMPNSLAAIEASKDEVTAMLQGLGFTVLGDDMNPIEGEN